MLCVLLWMGTPVILIECITCEGVLANTYDERRTELADDGSFKFYCCYY